MKKFITAILILLAVQAMALAGAPTQSSTNLQVKAQKADSDKLTLTFTRGNGAYRIVVVQEGAPVAEIPANGVDYKANAAFGTRGTEFTAAEGYVVYRGSSLAAKVTVTISKVKPGTTYYISIFEFNGKGTRTEYLTTPLNAVAGNEATTKATAAVNSVKEEFTGFYNMESLPKELLNSITRGINRWRLTTKDIYPAMANKKELIQYNQRPGI